MKYRAKLIELAKEDAEKARKLAKGTHEAVPMLAEIAHWFDGHADRLEIPASEHWQAYEVWKKQLYKSIDKPSKQHSLLQHWHDPIGPTPSGEGVFESEFTTALLHARRFNARKKGLLRQWQEHLHAIMKQAKADISEARKTMGYIRRVKPKKQGIEKP